MQAAVINQQTQRRGAGSAGQDGPQKGVFDPNDWGLGGFGHAFASVRGRALPPDTDGVAIARFAKSYVKAA